MENKTLFHGECVINKVFKLPEGLKKANLFDKKSYKLADSETTGNHHLLEAKEGVELFEDSNGGYLVLKTTHIWTLHGK